MKKLTITEDAVSSYSFCQRKSFQHLFQSNEADKPKYANFLTERIHEAENKFFVSNKDSLPFTIDRMTGKADIILNAKIEVGNQAVNNTHLQRRKGKSKLGSYYYEPLIFSSSNKVTVEDRTRSAYIGYVLNNVQGVKPTSAAIVLVNGSRRTIRLDKAIATTILSKLNEWTHSSEIPAVTFNKHCPSCPFNKQCQTAAEKADSLTLLGNMTPKVVAKFESKGIFTIKQLSYLYKPRRRSHRWGDRKPVHQYELQALALRTQKIYTDSLLELQKSNIEIYVDIESIPDQKFHYLIGVLISTSRAQRYHPFWAKDATKEKEIWNKFLKIVSRYPNAPIFHYGSYEKKVVNELADRYSTNAGDVLDRLSNINEYIYGRIYFPTRTNRLKDICEYLGCKWSADDASGLNSIMWHYNYDRTNEPKIKRDLITYNQEDCENLKKLKDVVCTICSHEPAMQEVRAADDNDQLLSASGDQVVKDFAALIKSAHGKYEKSKISIRKKSNREREKSTKTKARTIPKSKIDKEVRVARGRACPQHKRALLQTKLVGDAIIIDLVSTARGIKKITTRFWGYKGRCPFCSHRHNPPSLQKYGRNAKYGYGLKAWIAYQRLAMRLPLRKISQLLEDSFNIEIAGGGINSLFQSVSSNYIRTEKNILKKMLDSPKIHVDETLVNIQGKIQYVWVFTDSDRVIFRLTPTRDSSIVHQILKNYEGVLVSDFFAGYDSVECSQQRCWVHLIRDINDDLRKSPFDSEFDMFVSQLRDLFIPIIDTVNKYGLKKRNLKKFRKIVDRFYRKHIDGLSYTSDLTKRYQKRLTRYKEKLFVFLERDEIPWNNNMAERALRHLAVQRKISGSFFASAMEGYLVILGIMQTCRFQNKPFLEFLMSNEMDIDEFRGKKGIRGWTMR